jgi:hypothetical protein
VVDPHGKLWSAIAKVPKRQTGKASVIAFGDEALNHNTSGAGNAAFGDRALWQNTTGNVNTAYGADALPNNTTGSDNIAIGNDAGDNVTTANNVICIGVTGRNMSNTCYIGNIFAAAVDGSPIVIDGSNQLGITVSSRRFKEAIRPMGQASEALLALKPVTFHYKNETKRTSQFGLVAEEVERVNVAEKQKGRIMNPLIRLRKIIAIAIALLLARFAVQVAPNAFGVVPPPDGGYPNFNTAEGT